MSSPGFPVSVDPSKYAEQQIEVKGSIAFDEMPRLIESVRNSAGAADVRLKFDKDEQRRVIVTGDITANVVLECQRCLGEMAVTLSPEMSICVVHSDEQAKNLPKAYDPYLIDGYELVLAELVEEELLLGIPAFGTHDPEQCPVKYQNDTGEEQSKHDQNSNPFSILADLKVKK